MEEAGQNSVAVTGRAGMAGWGLRQVSVLAVHSAGGSAYWQQVFEKAGGSEVQSAVGQEMKVAELSEYCREDEATGQESAEADIGAPTSAFQVFEPEAVVMALMPPDFDL